MLANAFRDYPIWTYIQPNGEKRFRLLRWIMKRYLRGLLAKSGRRQGYAFAVRDGGALAGLVLLWRPNATGDWHGMRMQRDETEHLLHCLCNAWIPILPCWLPW